MSKSTLVSSTPPPGSMPTVEPPAPSAASEPPIPQSPKGVTKRVTLTCDDRGLWSEKVELLDVTKPFTQRDFNQLEQVLRVKAVKMKYEAAQQYLKLQREKAESLTSQTERSES